MSPTRPLTPHAQSNPRLTSMTPSPKPLSGSPARSYPRSSPLSFSPRQLLRPSIRLKTALYLLVLSVILLVILALNAASLSTPRSADTTLSTAASPDTPADTGEGKDVAQGKDAHLLEEEIQRSFEEPDFALLASRQPYQIGCDIPLEGEDKGVLVFLGIFSAADSKERRDL
jgi:hypothetical protein